ncbi:hypothetical protein WG66_008915 [Moniliophthora roreri]|nr:hypothetical protein WG66_008915 [Moniliophthora roreri]
MGEICRCSTSVGSEYLAAGTTSSGLGRCFVYGVLASDMGSGEGVMYDLIVGGDSLPASPESLRSGAGAGCFLRTLFTTFCSSTSSSSASALRFLGSAIGRRIGTSSTLLTTCSVGRTSLMRSAAVQLPNTTSFSVPIPSFCSTPVKASTTAASLANGILVLRVIGYAGWCRVKSRI